MAFASVSPVMEGLYTEREYRKVTPEYLQRDNCRSCSSERLTDILSLGKQHLVGFEYPPPEKEDDERDWLQPKHTPTPVRKIPLDLILCQNCHLLQLKHTTNPDLLWDENYGYRSGVNQTMKDELASIVASAEALKQLEDDDIVIDIGCNDGTLLSFYDNPKVFRVGFDPARNVVGHAARLLPAFAPSYWKIFVDYFHAQSFKKAFENKKARIITAIAIFYDLDDPNEFLSDVKEILSQDGIFIIQQNYLVGMLKNNTFDNIVHEHLEYYSLLSLEPLLNRHELEIFDVSENDINGGSFRTYICHKGKRVISQKVEEMRQKEEQLQLNQPKTYQEFSNKVQDIVEKLSTFILSEVEKGKKVYVYGASTRGNTLLQAAGLDYRQITAAADRNPEKWGKITVGTKIPIISEEEARAAKPDYFLVLPWHFAQGLNSEIIQREKDYILSGGYLIIPLPEFRIISKGNLT